jgi:hypothetical protein
MFLLKVLHPTRVNITQNWRIFQLNVLPEKIKPYICTLKTEVP